MRVEVQNILRIALVVAVGCAGGGCRGPASRRGLLEREAANAQLSSHQLRVMVNDFAAQYADRIEVAADAILAQTTDPEIRRNALHWKINGISAGFHAASRPNALGAYLDLCVLNRQMSDLLRSPSGPTLFGPGLPIAIDACQSLDRRLQFIDQSLGGEINVGDELVNQFAEDYPLQSLYFDREPIASRYINEVKEPAHEMFEVLANLDDSMEELKKLSVVYAEHLPKQARWEAELFLLDSSQLALVQQPLQELSAATDALLRVTRVTEEMPELVRQERATVYELLAGERQKTMLELEGMRARTVGDIERERAIVLAAVREERQAVLAQLSEEREIIGRVVRTEVSRTLQATDAISQRRTAEVLQETPAIIDHFVARLASMAVIIGGFVLLVIGGGWWLQRRGAASARRATLPFPEVGVAHQPKVDAPRAAPAVRRAA